MSPSRGVPAMASPFDTHLDRGNKALDDRDAPGAATAFAAALAAAAAPHERALALDGAAIASYRQGEAERALELLDQAIAQCLPQPDAETPADGPVAHALARIWYDKAGLLGALGRLEESVDSLDGLIRRFAARAGAAMPRDDEGLRARLAIARAMDMKAHTLTRLDRKREAIACYEDAIRLFQAVADDGRVMQIVAGAMIGRGLLLGDAGREDEEIAAYDAVVARYGEGRLPELSHLVLKALENKLLTYRDQEDYEAVVEVCDELIRRYESDAGASIADVVGRTMIRKAGALNKLGRIAQELACYDKVTALYGASAEPEMRKHAAEALIGKAVTLNEADQTASEMECYEEILRRYAEDRDERVRAVAAHALIYKGLSLRAIAEDAAEDTGVLEIEAELACYDRVVERYGEEEFVGLQQAVAEALQHKGETLLETGHTAKAAACFDAVIGAYAESPDETLREIVTDARELRAEC